MNDHLILRVVGKFLIPYVMLFGLYVQFHGDFGPGGGFQAGVIFASGFVIYTLLFGLRSTQQIVSEGFLRVISASGVLIYAGVGVASMLMGGEFLNYNVLAANPIAGQHIGIMVIEFGVGLTVASTMTLLLMMFAERGLPS
ncbi:MAG: Na(+)/H(+) antiporter subunit B [Pseudohongiella sp.]|nr:Na(+)/H(+) antiporter subunit B [Pseudohongiella sp.]MDO9519788.1 Na(+)/H(+) antiporter subunit B [Pseudohongiella sp.]MDP2126246.1 Na(+)/H(+) antiporter subunit B [Pseudohongiella sp.]